MSLKIPPLRPYMTFTDGNGNLTKDAYDFLHAIFKRVGGSLENLNAATLQDHTWSEPGDIGDVTPATGSFTNLTASGAVAFTGLNSNLTFAPTGTGVVSISPVSVGNINNMSIGATTPHTGAFTSLSATSTTTLTGPVTINSSTVGAINNVNIGAVTAGTGRFSSVSTTGLTATGPVSLTSSSVGNLDNVNVGSTTAGTGRFSTLTSTGAVTFTTGTINGVSIGATTASTGRFSTLLATGAVTFTTGTINGVSVGATTASTGRFTTVTATGAFGCNGKSAQTAYASGGPVATTVATNVVAIDSTGTLAGSYGFTTQAQADALVTKLNAVIAALVANGIMS